jgi:hypothetical protein
MSQDGNIADAIKNFSSVDEIIESCIGRHVEGSLESGNRFWGVLEHVDETWLYLRGYRNQPIVIKRKKLAALMEAL